MLLSFVGTSMLSAFLCLCLSPLVSASGINLTVHVMGLPFAISFLFFRWARANSWRGECFLTLVFVVLLGVWLEAGDSVSLFWILDTLGGHCPSWRHFETASIVAMLYFQGRYFLILLQSYGAADVHPSVAGALACPMICEIFFLFFTIPAGLHVKKRVKCQKSMVTTFLCHPIASELSI